MPTCNFFEKADPTCLKLEGSEISKDSGSFLPLRRLDIFLRLFVANVGFSSLELVRFWATDPVGFDDVRTEDGPPIV